ncbi:unnamed protein product [Polarella glacialis]|uniref:Uncharacterized protein n=1 Tax=Polarella glacialis TaxID=89957 RepID=A0A813DPH3_POLGL|nr:unnamed protein product [Polarella glacialis]CAE8601673.1 unnamed protein product [Polarella glacialis]CAE8680263.1 unnamed protein product [Polarella glacialis]
MAAVGESLKSDTPEAIDIGSSIGDIGGIVAEAVGQIARNSTPDELGKRGGAVGSAIGDIGGAIAGITGQIGGGIASAIRANGAAIKENHMPGCNDQSSNRRV